MRFCGRPRRFSPRRNSTADRSDGGLHRYASRDVSQGAIPTDPSLSLSLGRRRRGCNNPRAFAQNRGETGSLETAPSATQSPRCSHSGIVQGQPRVFPGIQALSAGAGAAAVRRDASGAGWRPVSGRSSREPVSVVRVVRSRDTRPAAPWGGDTHSVHRIADHTLRKAELLVPRAENRSTMMSSDPVSRCARESGIPVIPVDPGKSRDQYF